MCLNLKLLEMNTLCLIYLLNENKGAMLFGEGGDCGRNLELLARKAIEWSEINELLWELKS